MAKKTEIMRVDPEFAKIVKNIPLQRIREGKDNFLRPPNQITRAMVRDKDMQKIVKRLLEAKD